MCRRVSVSFVRKVSRKYSNVIPMRGMWSSKSDRYLQRKGLGFSPLSMKSTANAQSLLFPMESVFESYVASILRRNLADGVTLSTQLSLNI
nr:hypothetical protein [Vibrio atlanticus]